MKALVLGHSYVRDLSHLGRRTICLPGGNCLDLHYIHKSGGKFIDFLSKEDWLSLALSIRPDFIIVILGGNDIANSISTEDLHKSCRNFYKFLRDQFPLAKIIASQIELRFYNQNNFFNSPSQEEFDLRRKTLNTFIKRLKTKDCLLQVQGPGRLDDSSFYRDKVHLNAKGLNKYFDFITNTINFCFNKFCE